MFNRLKEALKVQKILESTLLENTSYVDRTILENEYVFRTKPEMLDSILPSDEDVELISKVIERKKEENKSNNEK